MNSLRYKIPLQPSEVFQKSIEFGQSFPFNSIRTQEFNEEKREGVIIYRRSNQMNDNFIIYQMEIKGNLKNTFVSIDIKTEPALPSTEIADSFNLIIEWCKVMQINPFSIKRTSYYALWTIAGLAIIAIVLLKIL
ncbi:hypothetical protein NEF87_000023 [Candidatus Lokiarchaeum ossiferum]|uniref:Uncharacterized protein n=1 Tax=Candidatus Lokiarchaeum ossiferum TaxID=2951803 RepID=A0ABY6HJQ2_9ARCH|nr:hypothetical protein NEF87_000023 [Candidatus Lokiarchaeum sp. B-35]